MKPLIGITVECEHQPDDARTRGELHLHWNYAQAVSDHGGVPILIPPTANVAEIARVIEGWLIPGGPDIDARHWGEENHPKVGLQDPARYQAEADLYKAIPPGLPILGICYGCQFLNVIRGGSLIQHVPDVVGNEDHSSGGIAPYKVTRESLLAKATERTIIEGKSYHHQAIGRLGAGLKVAAKHEDGIIEAIEATDRPWIVGVQWHPERTLEDEATANLMKGFISACIDFAKSKCQ